MLLSFRDIGTASFAVELHSAAVILLYRIMQCPWHACRMLRASLKLSAAAVQLQVVMWLSRAVMVNVVSVLLKCLSC